MIPQNRRQDCQTHLEKTVQMKRELYALERLSPFGSIETERVALGIKRSEIAQRLGTPQQNLSQMMRRLKRGAVTVKSIRKIADALNCDVVLSLVPRGDGTISAWRASVER